MKRYLLQITDREYADFRSHPATRLYLSNFRRTDGTLEITTRFPQQLARDLETVIDFGATSAREVLGL